MLMLDWFLDRSFESIAYQTCPSGTKAAKGCDWRVDWQRDARDGCEFHSQPVARSYYLLVLLSFFPLSFFSFHPACLRSLISFSRRFLAFFFYVVRVPRSQRWSLYSCVAISQTLKIYEQHRPDCHSMPISLQSLKLPTPRLPLFQFRVNVGETAGADVRSHL